MRKASMQSRLKQQLGQAQQLHASKKYEEAEKVAAEVALAASTELGNTSILAIESANTLGLILLSQADRTVTNQVSQMYPRGLPVTLFQLSFFACV